MAAEAPTPEALVIGYACALDARDWPAYRALFTDTIALDYGAIGSITGPIAADEWVARCRALEGFHATLHRLSNLRCTIAGETAQVDSYVDALHFVTDSGIEHCGRLAGRYHHRLKHGPDGWRISGCTLHVAGYPGGQAAFAHAFAIARARAQRTAA